MVIPVFDLSQVTGIRKNSTTPPLISTRAGLIDGTRPGGGDPDPTPEGALTDPSRFFTININAVGGTLGATPSSASGSLAGKDVFTGDASNTVYSDEVHFNGRNSLKMTIDQGSTGFGSFGGICNFADYSHGVSSLLKGDEVWVKTRIFFPLGFEFNQNGRNKFLRMRVFHDEGGTPVSEGYNDLYIDRAPGISVFPAGPENSYFDTDVSPLQFIFEGAPQWYLNGQFPDHAFNLGSWHTVQTHYILDNQRAVDGGSPLVRVWFDDELIGETTERETLAQADSYLASLYYFTYWDDNGGHVTQSCYVDEIIVTSERPSTTDASGNPFIGNV